MKKQNSASISSKQLGKKQIAVVLDGSLDVHSVTELWNEARTIFASRIPDVLIVEAEGVEYLDNVGYAFLLWMRKQQLEGGKEFILEGLSDEYRKMMEILKPHHEPIRQPGRKFKGLVEDVGISFYSWWKGLHKEIAFVGELFFKLLLVFLNPFKLRLKDTMMIAESSGANAFGIVSLIGLLFGLILAFQSAIPMKMFGAELYVADLVSLSLLRVLGAFIASVIYAARSGSAFAAEIGTMKVNEEIDALVTLGLDPVIFLVVPRVVAATIVVPMLTLCVIVFGLLGAGLVMLSLGFPMVTYVNQVLGAVDMVDFTSGFVKAFIFGFLVSAVGCYRGLCTGTGSRAVGDAATRAVVSGILLIVIAEGTFAVLYYYLGI